MKPDSALGLQQILHAFIDDMPQTSVVQSLVSLHERIELLRNITAEMSNE